MHRLQPRKLRKYRLFPRIEEEDANGSKATVAPQSGQPTEPASKGGAEQEKQLEAEEAGEKTVEETEKTAEEETPLDQAELPPASGWQIPVPQNTLSDAGLKRLSLRLPQLPPLLSSHPLFTSEANGDSKDQSTELDELSVKCGTVEPDAVPDVPDAAPSPLPDVAQDPRQSTCSRQQARSSHFSQTSTASASQPSTTASPDTSLDLPKKPDITGPSLRKVRSTPFAKLSKLSRKFSHARLGSKASDESDSASVPAVPPLPPVLPMNKTPPRAPAASVRTTPGRSFRGRNTSSVHSVASVGNKKTDTNKKEPDGMATGRAKGDTNKKEAGRKPLPPPWDRTLDVAWQRSLQVKWTDTRKLLAFQSAVVKLVRDSGHRMAADVAANRYFKLPDAVRLRICEHLVGDGGGKTVRLNNHGAYADVWPAAYFESLHEVLGPLERYTAVSFAFRADVLATVFTTRHFHVVWSPYVQAQTSAAAVGWMKRHAGLMQSVTVELDLSRLGFGRQHEAAGLRPGTLNVAARVMEFVDAQRERDRHSPLFELRILVRRYYGRRKDPEGTQGDPYCDDKHLSALDPLKCLRGLVERARIVGCSEAYARDLITYLWPSLPTEKGVWDRHCCRIAPSTLYPLLPGQLSCLDYGPRRGSRVLIHPDVFYGLHGVRIEGPKIRREEK